MGEIASIPLLEKQDNKVDFKIHFGGDLIEIDCQSLSQEEKIKLAYKISSILDPDWALDYKQSEMEMSKGHPLRPGGGIYGITIAYNGNITADIRNASGDSRYQQKLVSAVEQAATETNAG